jgi:hypothetical protein
LERGSAGIRHTYFANSFITHNRFINIGANGSEHAELLNSLNCHSSDGAECAGGPTQCVQDECASNTTYAFNYSDGPRGSSTTGGLVSLRLNSHGLKDWKIYGNLFLNCGGGNGCITTGEGFVGLDGTLIYNNTFVSDSANYGSSIVYNNCVGDGQQAPVFKNNIVWGRTSLGGADALFGNCGLGPGTPLIVHEYNSYGSITGGYPSETGGQTAIAMPFVSLSQTAFVGDFHLANDTSVNSGTPLGSPYDVDADGVTRTEPDRGMFEKN